MDESSRIRNCDDDPTNINNNNNSSSSSNATNNTIAIVSHVGNDLNPVMDTLHQMPHSLSAHNSSALANDSRLEFISSYTLTTLRLKQDKWLKMMATPEYQFVVLDWLDSAQRRTLVMALNPAGLLIPKSSISDLYQNYTSVQVIKSPTAAAELASSTNVMGKETKRPGALEAEGAATTTSTTFSNATTTAVATLAASIAMTPLTAGIVMLAPLPSPSSSFSTLDGVPRGKCAFFVRRESNVPLTDDNFVQQVIYGDFPVHSKIDTLLILFDEILQPLLINPQNRRLWPDVVGKDLNNRMKDVRNTLTQIKGKTNNRTILSLLVSPTVIQEIARHLKEQGNVEPPPSSLDSKFRGQLEEMVINWTSQVYEIINEKSECSNTCPQRNKSNTQRLTLVTLPAQEINFWLNRQQNLQNLFKQLNSPSHKAVGWILQELTSPYYPSFAKMLKTVVCAWHEAQDVALWLQPLLRQTTAFNAVTFVNAQELIAPLVHVIHLVWSNARHYRSTARMTTLLRCICNLMIRRASEDLELATLFQGDAEEGLQKINKTMKILEMFKSKLLEYKNKYGSNQTILPALQLTPTTSQHVEEIEGSASNLNIPVIHQLWRFSNEDVFGHALNGFLEQLSEIQTVFEAAVSFQSLEKLEIGGCIGKLLTERIRQIHSDFKMLFEEWTKLEIDLSQASQHPSAVNSSGNNNHNSMTYHKNTNSWQIFRREQAIFFQNMEVLEKKLATILLQAFGDCHNWEQLTKLTTMFANIVQRQTIQSELQVILPHLLSVYGEELLLIESIVSEVLLAFEYRGIEAIIPLERITFPPMAGAMMWLENYQRRCDVFASCEVNALINVLMTSSQSNNDANPLNLEYEKLTARRNILTTKLSNLQLKVWHNWQQTIEKRIAQGLDTKVMTLHQNSGNDKFGCTNKTPQWTREWPSNNNCNKVGGDITATTTTSGSVNNVNNNNNNSNTWTSNYPHRYQVVTNIRCSSATSIPTTTGMALSESSSTPGDDNTKILEMHYSSELFTLLRETKYLLALQQVNERRKVLLAMVSATFNLPQQMQQQQHQEQLHPHNHHHQQQLGEQQQQHHQSLPQSLLDLYEERDIFWQRKIRLMQISEYYNGIRHQNSGLTTTAFTEMQLIHPSVSVIDEKLDFAAKTLTWRNYDEQLIEEIYSKTKALHQNLVQTRSNIELILKSIQRWSREPLHQRSIYGKNLLEIRHQAERLRIRIVQCEETKSLLNRLLIKNFCLFFHYDIQMEEGTEQNIHQFLLNYPDDQRDKYNQYLKSIDDMIYNEVRQSMKISLEYLLNEMATTATVETSQPLTTKSTAATTTAGVLAEDLATVTPTIAAATSAAIEENGGVNQTKTIKSIQTLTPTATTSTELTVPKTTTTTSTKHFLPHLLKAIHCHQEQQPNFSPDDPTSSIYPTTVMRSTQSSTNSSSSNTQVGVPTTKAPLFEVKLQLLHAAQCITFEPSLETSEPTNFQQIVDQLLVDIEKACKCIPRVFQDDTPLTPSNEYDNNNDDKGNMNDVTFHQVQAAHVYAKMPSQMLVATAAATTATTALLPSREDKVMNATNVATITQTEDNNNDILNAVIRNMVTATVNAAKAYASNFQVYAHLWSEKYSQVLNRQLCETVPKAVVAAATTEDRGYQDAGSVASDKKEEYTMNRGYYVMETFKREIERYIEMHDVLEQFDDFRIINGWLLIDIRPLKYSLLNMTCKWSQFYKKGLLLYVERTLERLTIFIEQSFELLQLHVARDDFRSLLKVLEVIARIKKKEKYADHLFKPLKEIVQLLKTYHVQINGQFARAIDQMPLQWQHLKTVAAGKIESLQETQRFQQQRVSGLSQLFACHLQTFAKQFQKMEFFATPCSKVYSLCDNVCLRLHCFDMQHKRISHCAQLLEIAAPDDSLLRVCAIEVKRVKQLWDFVHVIESCINDWRASPWLLIDTDDIENECKQFTRDLRTLDKSIREWAPYLYIVAVLRELVASLRTITELQNPSITERHWLELIQETQLAKRFPLDYLLSFKLDNTSTLDELMKLELHKHDEEIRNTVDRAIKEMNVTKILDDIKAIWSRINFDREPHQRRQVIILLKVSEGLIETLDDNQMQIQNIATSKHVDYLLEKLNHWQRVLSGVELFIANWFEVQRKWVYLECIFIGSPDIRAQLPKESQFFEEIDREFIGLLNKIQNVQIAIDIVTEHCYVFEALEELQKRLLICEKALNNYLETKRLAFPRFYFISSADLLDILSNGNNPQIIERHFIKLFDSILRLSFASYRNHNAIGMYSKENNEYVPFISPEGIPCEGRVELWLQILITEMRHTLHELFSKALQVQTEKSRDKWLNDWPAQVALCCSQISWTADVNRAFAWMEEGYEAAMKDLHKNQIVQLNSLINLLLGELTPGDRQKIMTICTIDVHSRDVVSRIIQARVDSSFAFQWQSQLRHRWTEVDESGEDSLVAEDCFANICDAEFRYAYEYLGNTSRLVITPLTDRCYITLTQSLHLVMGGAPAGPAGTGKTETTKDLGRALGVMVYVFNCSEQMDYKSCGNIYKGLAQTGAWGCFDEFNRISVEVLSVVAVQVKTIQAAIKMHKSQFVFMGETIALVPSVGIFITMNPGYAGRTELPENLKSLFRPCGHDCARFCFNL
ncbi:dynein beta chain, ciliary-like [Musca autumnalis]|uniref:dynein beta chain, ciliary-like n=1 Tax=Musca autumnalis TaxID=221902 RepID=UPI003CF23CC6